jgi:hypothetical protein
MNLNNLLIENQIDPQHVLVLRHRPFEPDLRKVFPLIAADRPDLFNAYQQTHGERVEKVMLGVQYVLSMLGMEPGRAVFVGLYKVGKTKPLSYAQYWRISQHIELKRLGMKGFSGRRASCLWFDLKLQDFYKSWKGKLVVDWPPPERAWWRRAHRNVMPVRAILEESAFETVMKEWDELDITWNEIAVLSKRFQERLSEWRGIYLIFDASDRKGYVGSAYGADNILGRWRNYARSGHGGNRLLRQRDPHNFRFTILERVSPDMKAEDVIQRENSWKERLHTRQPFGLNIN